MIEIRNPSGEYQRAFYYPYKNVPLSEGDAVNSTPGEFLKQFVRQNELPQTWPALNDMLIDDQSRLWVSEDFDLFEWWVLEETGELLAQFTLPRNEAIDEVKNGYVYARETDEETRLQKIVRYWIQMDP